VTGVVALVPTGHCIVCKAQAKVAAGVQASIPHCVHNQVFPKNLKTRGLSEYSVFIKRYASANLAVNSLKSDPKLSKQSLFLGRGLATLLWGENTATTTPFDFNKITTNLETAPSGEEQAPWHVNSTNI